MTNLIKQVMTALLIAGCLVMTPVGSLLAVSPADRHIHAVQEGSSLYLRDGPFGGKSESGEIWVGDMVFEMADNFKVIGTSKKLGMLSDVKEGELVILLFKERGAEQIPLAIELRRQ